MGGQFVGAQRDERKNREKRFLSLRFSPIFSLDVFPAVPQVLAGLVGFTGCLPLAFTLVCTFHAVFFSPNLKGKYHELKTSVKCATD